MKSSLVKITSLQNGCLARSEVCPVASIEKLPRAKYGERDKEREKRLKKGEEIQEVRLVSKRV